jgi:hypothetical protein
MDEVRRALEREPGRPIEVVSSGQTFDLCLRSEGAVIHTLAADGSELLSGLLESESDVAQRLSSRLLGWAHWLRVRALRNPPSSLSVDFRLTAKGASASAAPGEIVAFQPGSDRFDVTVANRSQRKVLVYILDLTSSGKVHQVYPPDNSNVPVDAGATLQIPGWDVDIPEPALGAVRDVFKLVASTAQVDLSFLEAQALRRTPPSDPLSRLLFDAAVGTRDASRAVGVDWTTAEVTFDVCRELLPNGQCAHR